MVEKILAILPTNGHGGCEYNALSALKYFRDQHRIDVAASFPRVEETQFVFGLCQQNDIPVEPLTCAFRANDDAESVQLQRRATWDLLDRVCPAAVFLPIPWPMRGQGVIAGCADTHVPTIVKFALVPPVWRGNEFVMPEAKAAQNRRQVWFANSKFSANLIERHWGLPNNSVDSFHVGPIGLSHLVPPAASTTHETDVRSAVLKEFGLRAGCRIATTVARLSSQKGYDALMAAAPRLLETNPELVLLWVGHGDMQKEITAWIGEHRFRDRVKLAGFRADVRRLLKASDLFILPTVYEGGCSQALLEAMDERDTDIAVLVASGRPGTKVAEAQQAMIDKLKIIEPQSAKAMIAVLASARLVIVRGDACHFGRVPMLLDMLAVPGAVWRTGEMATSDPFATLPSIASVGEALDHVRQPRPNRACKLQFTAPPRSEIDSILGIGPGAESPLVTAAE